MRGFYQELAGIFMVSLIMQIKQIFYPVVNKNPDF